MASTPTDPQGPISLAILRQAVDVSNEGIVIAEQEGDDTILIYVNRAFEELTGFTADEILYQDCRFLQGSDRDQVARAELRAGIEQKKPVRVTLRNYRKDGSLFYNQLCVSPFYNIDDNLTYFIGVQRDITDLILAQERADAAEAELQRLLSQSQA
jgi:PAS domain S-box-containing protein